ncbi:MAG: D-glycero-alpha-D-manno-heptose-1,7-bisphosphate 7-phosphatase [Salibacteraceae bacterium]
MVANLSKAVFFDRDGIINHDPGDYTYQLSEFHILDGVPETMKVLQDKGYKLVVITNQAGIARGRYGHAEVTAIHQHLREVLAEYGVALTDILYCPHHNTTTKCLCRKPGSLLVERALARHRIDPQQSLLVGDKPRDIDAAEKTGVTCRLVPVNTSITFLQALA